MNKQQVFLTFLLLIGAATAWLYPPPDCLPSYSFNGINFTVSNGGQRYNCASNIVQVQSNVTYCEGYGVNGWCDMGPSPANASMYRWASYGSNLIQTSGGVPQPIHNTTARCYVGTGASSGVSCDSTAQEITCPGLEKDIAITINSTHGFYNISGGSTMSCPLTSTIRWVTKKSSFIDVAYYNTSYHLEFNMTVPYRLANISTNGNYFSYNEMNNKIIRSDFTVRKGDYFDKNNASSYCQAIVYTSNSYGTSQIIPLITYFPGSGAYANFYNTTTNAVSLRNNSVNYLYDSTQNAWFNVVPTCADYTQLNLFSAYLVPTTSTTQQATLPRIYSVLNCYQSGNNFTWNIVTSDSVTFSFAQLLTNGTLLTSSTTSPSYSGSVNIQNTSVINITDGTNQICAYGNGTNILFSSPLFLANQNLTRQFGSIMFIVAGGLTVATPFAGIFSIVLNDIFSFTDQSTLFAAIIGAIFLSFLVNARNEGSFKNIMWYIGIGGVVLAQFLIWYGTQSSTPIETRTAESIQAINATTNSFATLATGNTNLIEFAVNGVGFLTQLFSLFQQLPSIWSVLLIQPLYAINPALASAVNLFAAVLVAAPMLYIILKLYEVITRQFKNV